MRLAILASHPIQYQAPIFRLLARRVNLTVFYAHRASQIDQAKAGFGVGFDWDIDLATASARRLPGVLLPAGYQHTCSPRKPPKRKRLNLI